MGAALGVITAIVVFGFLLYAAFGAYGKRRHPRDGDKRP